MNPQETSPTLRRFHRFPFGNRALRVLLVWFFLSLFGACILTPMLYRVGKDFARSAETSDYPALLESLADSADRAKPERYFNRSLLLCSLSFLPFLIYRTKRLSPGAKIMSHKDGDLSKKWQIAYLSGGVIWGIFQIVLLSLILELIGVKVFHGDPMSFSVWIKEAMVPALGAGICEELIFRGLMIGLLLKACSKVQAWIGSSVIFSLLHFLHLIPGYQEVNPQNWYAGFQILGSIFGHFSQPWTFFTEFTQLLILGLFLGWFRIWMNSLWIPIGIHIGLVLALKTLSFQYSIDASSPLYPYFLGEDINSGLLPLILFAICSYGSVALFRRYKNA